MGELPYICFGGARLEMTLVLLRDTGSIWDCPREPEAVFFIPSLCPLAGGHGVTCPVPHPCPQEMVVLVWPQGPSAPPGLLSLHFSDLD